MKRTMTLFGVGLSVFAFVSLMIVVVLPAIVPLENLPFVNSVIQVLFCRSGEILNHSYSTFETPGTTQTSTDLQCVNSDGKRRDVSDDFIKAVFIGYLATFLGGLVIVGIAQYLPTRGAGPTTSPVQAFHEIHSTEGHQPVSGGTFPHPSLTDRLTDLKSALNAGLITQAEYDARREEILKET